MNTFNPGDRVTHTPVGGSPEPGTVIEQTANPDKWLVLFDDEDEPVAAYWTELEHEKP